MQLPMDDAGLTKDDEIKSINGTSITSLSDFREVYEALAIGDEMTIVALRNGEEVISKRPKAESQGGIRIRRSH